MEENYKINPYASFLEEKEWNYWCDFTTHYSLTLPACRSMMVEYFGILKPLQPTMFWVAERFKDKSGYHVHAILNLAKESAEVKSYGMKCYSDLWQVVSRKKKQHSRVGIEVFDRDRRWDSYITKGMWNKSLDYDLFTDET